MLMVIMTNVGSLIMSWYFDIRYLQGIWYIG